MISAREQVGFLAHELGPGDYRETCPACGGGSNSERSLALHVYPDGNWSAKCFRASCEFFSRTNLYQRRIKQAKEPRYFTAERNSLTADQRDWFYKRFGFVPEDTYYCPHSDRFAYKVHGPHFEPRGWIARSFSGAIPKALTYQEKPEDPFIGYSGPLKANHLDSHLVIVEDWLSAEKVGTATGFAVALNGCELTQPILRELLKVCNQGHGIIPVFAVDADAHHKSLKWAVEYGGLFAHAPRVWKLKQDLRYVPASVIRRAIENANYNDFTEQWTTGTKNH